MEKEKNKKNILFSYNGIEIYKEHDEDDEDGFVSFMGLHSLSTQGKNATVTMKEVLHFIAILKDGVSFFGEDNGYAMHFALSAICVFLEKYDNVECSYCSFATYHSLAANEKEEWFPFNGNPISDFFFKIKCEEW